MTEMSPAETLDLTAQVEKMERTRDAMTEWAGVAGDNPRNQLTGQIADLRMRLLAPAPQATQDPATVAARVAARQQRAALDAGLEAELKRHEPESAAALTVMQDILDLGAADAARQPDPTLIGWEDFTGTPSMEGWTLPERGRLEMVARSAHWTPVEAIGLASALESLRGMDLNALPELPALSWLESERVQAALQGVPVDELARLEALGVMKSPEVMAALTAIGRRKSGREC